MSKRLADLSAKLRKIDGVQILDAGKKKKGETGSSTQHLDSRFDNVNVVPEVPILQDVIEPTIPDPE